VFLFDPIANYLIQVREEINADPDFLNEFSVNKPTAA
jgi:hypothetical protein